MTIKDLESKVKSYRWLKDILSDYEKYEKRLSKEPENVRIEKIAFTCRGPQEEFFFNPHRAPNAIVLLDALRVSINNIKVEMKEIEDSLPDIDFSNIDEL